MSGTYYSNAGKIVQGQYVNQNNLTPASPYNQYSSNNAVEDIPTTTPKGRPCRDVFWAILFYAHLIGITSLMFIYTPTMLKDVAESVESQGSSSSSSSGNRILWHVARFLDDQQQNGNDDAYANNNNGGDNNSAEEVDIDPDALMVVLCLSSALGLVISTLALGFMMAFAETLIRISLLFNIFLFAALGMASAVGGAIVGALICFALSAFSAYYAYSVWNRIAFAAANLVTAITAVSANLGLAFYAYFSLLILFGWSILWSIAAVSTIYVTSGCNVDGQCQEDANPGVVFALLLSYYWTIQVISNVVHTTTAGTIGTWWMAPIEANGCCSRAVRDSYIRSITTSFGSICFGSLLVAIIQTVKEMVHSLRENGDSILMCCAECILGCLESLMEYFNKWAFVYVGLYGFSFMEAGTSVMDLFRARGWTTIITDYMVDTVLWMVSLGVGVITGLLGLTIAGAGLQLADSANLALSFLVGFIVGYSMCTTLLSVVSSAVNTVIVCYAEAPNEFQTNHPMLSERMRVAWREAWPGEFRY